MSQLRIRLEGRLEVLEQTAHRLDELLTFAREGWEAQPLQLLEVLDRWADEAPRRDDARQAAEREPQAKRWVDAVRAKESRLRARLESLLGGTAATRRRGLDRKLETWAELARSLGPRAADLEPLASGEGVVRSREWTVTFVAAAAVVFMKQPLLALLLAPIGVVWWDFCKSTVKWRMFKDCLELTEAERPVRRIPLESIEEIDGQHVKGLWDLSLRGESGFLDLAVDVRRALTERQTRERYGDNPHHAAWLPASLHVGEPPKAQHGWVLSCESGLAFVPDAAMSLAWYVVVGAPPLDGRADIGAELRSLPAALFEEKVVDLGRLKGCVWLGGLGQAAFQSLGEILLVVVDGQRRVFVRCSLAAQSKLLERVR